MRTTHHLQHIDFTTENATSSRITTSATNSTRISTSSSVTQLQTVSLDPITSSLATVLQTSLQKTYANINATTSVSLFQTYTSNLSHVNLARATTSRYPKKNALQFNFSESNNIPSTTTISSNYSIYWKDWNTSPIYFCASTNPK